MQTKYIWAVLLLIAGISLTSWNTTGPATHATNTPLAYPVPPAAAPLPKLVPRPPTPQTAEDQPLNVQIDRLIATHDPENAYAAYWLIANCEIFNRQHDRLIFDKEEVIQNRNLIPYRGMTDSEKQHDTKLCTGMTERMRVSRLDYLANAVKAGVSGALLQMADEGPFGDRTALTTRADDPLVKEWKTTVLDQLAKEAEGGDLVTLNYLWMHALTGDALVSKDPVLAYRYAVALGLIDGEVNGPKGTEAIMYAPEGRLLTAIADLSAQQRMLEVAAAQRIAANARERRRRELALSR